MPFTLVPPPAVDANAYSDLDYALAQADAWEEGASFLALDDAEPQSKLLATASRRIDNAIRTRLIGSKQDSAQVLLFPLTSTDGVPQDVVNATVLFAFLLADLKTSGSVTVAAAGSAQVKRTIDKIGSIEEEREYFAAPILDEKSSDVLPPEVQALLHQYLAIPSDSTWGSAEVCAVRA